MELENHPQVTYRYGLSCVILLCLLKNYWTNLYQMLYDNLMGRRHTIVKCMSIIPSPFSS